jgi:RNA polymerase sigma-70 factor, ECF subfamily
MLRRYLSTLGARPDNVDDLVQEVFVTTMTKRPEDRGPDALGAWLRGVAKNLLLRERRTAASRREVELADEVWREECDDGDGGELLDALQHCVGRLPGRSRAMLQSAYGEGAGRAGIGAEFGLQSDGVKTALRRLRAILRQCVERRLRGGR